jgi:metallo-beta-lactamase family protein
MRLTFHGAAGCVTGSRTLVEGARGSVLVDCGMFQGYKELRLLNWQRFPASAARIDAVALTHAHLDHSGWLPRLLREGFDGTVLCTPATRDLAKVLLEDAAKIQEADARQANRQGWTRHQPAKPLFTLAEAKGVLRRFKAVRPGAWSKAGGLEVRFTPNGHILGSAMVEVRGDETILFSGDLGRPADAVMPAPLPPPPCDRLVLEATYGDRLHGSDDPVRSLQAALLRTQRRKGVLVVPSFAVGRSQAILLHLHQAMASGKCAMPVYLDSPMSSDALAIMTKHIGLTRVDPALWRAVVRGVQVVGDADESAGLARKPRPFVVVSSSGMATGGRVLGHLQAFAPDRANTVLLAGFQAGGTRGAALLAGAKEVKVHGRMVPVRADVRQLENVSAHADQDEVVDWASRLPRAPSTVYLNHGEPAASNALRARLKERFGWDVVVPRMGDAFEAGKGTGRTPSLARRDW